MAIDFRFLKKNGFEISYNDNGTLFADTIETYQHKEDGLNFKYKYSVEVSKDDNNTLYFYIRMYPIFKSLNKKTQKSALDFLGTENERISLYCGFDANVCCFDLTFQEKEIENYEKDNYEYLYQNLDSIKKDISTMNGMFGFFMDAHQSPMFTGWDEIKKLIK